MEPRHQQPTRVGRSPRRAAQADGWAPADAASAIGAAYRHLVATVAGELEREIRALAFSGWDVDVDSGFDDGDGTPRFETLEHLMRIRLRRGTKEEPFFILAFSSHTEPALRLYEGGHLVAAAYALATDIMAYGKANGWCPGDWESEPRWWPPGHEPESEAGSESEVES